MKIRDPYAARTLYTGSMIGTEFRQALGQGFLPKKFRDYLPKDVYWDEMEFKKGIRKQLQNKNTAPKSTPGVDFFQSAFPNNVANSNSTLEDQSGMER